MAEDAAEEARRKQALASLASYIFKNMYGTNWSMAADISGYPIDWGRHNRLTRVQFFHDDDYLVAILRFITDVFDGNTQSFNIMTAFIFDEKVPDDANVRVALSTLGVIPSAGDAASFQTPLSLSIPVRLIDVNAFPDDFYRDLVHLTNKAYEAGLFATVPLLVRKLLENLVVDALRLYYGMKDVTVFSIRVTGDFTILAS